MIYHPQGWLPQRKHHMSVTVGKLSETQLRKFCMTLLCCADVLDYLPTACYGMGEESVCIEILHSDFCMVHT